MKRKLLCLILSFLIIIPLFSNGENAVAKYDELLRGQWNSAGYSSVPQKSNHCTNLNYFIYPGQNGATEKYGKVTTNSILFGDDTGAVYLYLSSTDAYDTYRETVGRVYLSQYETVLLLICEDGSTFFYTKE